MVKKAIVLSFFLLFLFTGYSFAEQIHDAARSGDLTTVKSLLEKGADVAAYLREKGGL